MQQWLGIRAGETTKVALMFLYLFLAVSVFISGRITRDALFLDAFSKETLAYMYITVALVVPCFSYLYARVADRFRRDRIILVTLGLLCGSLLVAHGAVQTRASWVYVALYNWIEVVGTFLIIQFWTFAGDIFSSREAKRLFPIVSLGGIFASMLAGLAVSGATTRLGIPTSQLLLPQAVLLVACMTLVWHLGERERIRLKESVVGRSSGREHRDFGVKSEVRDVFQSKHLKLIAGMTVATFITVPLIDYQFKVLVKAQFPLVDEYSAFMGYFYSASGVVAAVMQFGLTPRILERFGVVVSLLILPVFLLAGTGGMAIGLGAFSLAVFSKGAENSFRYSIYDATMQVIYTPVPGNVRGRAKTFIDGILKPWAGGIAGAVITVMVGPLDRPVTDLAYVGLGLTLFWIVLILRIRREYVSQLLSSLRRRRLDFSEQELVIADEATVQVLRRALQGRDLAELRNAVELCRRVTHHDLTPEVGQLLHHGEADIRVRALQVLELRGSFGQSEEVKRLFEDHDEEVRAAAVRAYCAILGEPALKAVRPMLEQEAPGVRAATVTSLIKHGGLEGILMSAEHLRDMQASADEGIRLAAAQVYRDVGVKNFYQQVMSLMRDRSLRVQNAAITAAGAMQAPEFIPMLIYKLGRRETARAASAALCTFGESVIEVLGKVLAHEPEEVAIRRQIPRILERIGTPRCLEVLMACLEVHDPDARRETARAVARLRDRLRVNVDESKVRTVLRQELHDYYRQLAALDDLTGVAGAVGPDLLRNAIEERLERSLDRIFRFLAIIFPLKLIEIVQANLKSQQLNMRANAVELLDNLLDKELKRQLLPILEDLPRQKVIAQGTEFFPLERRPAEHWIGQFLVSREPWLVTVALYVVAELGLQHLLDDVLVHLEHRDPVARETTVRTLAVLMPAADFLKRVLPLVNDDDTVVRRYTKYITQEARKVVRLAEDRGEISGPLLRAPGRMAAEPGG
ncbi:MAG: Npt1/Npt2 family nucleotide transporter [Myxococcota bacterium]